MAPAPRAAVACDRGSGGGRYDVLELHYPGGELAILRNIDGSGFAYYPSGRKAICISAHGVDTKGRTRRFSAIVHDDSPHCTILGSFDDQGIGNANAMRNPGDKQSPQLLFSAKELIVIDGHGQMTTAPRNSATGRGGYPSAPGTSTDVVLRLNTCVTLQHKAGRTSLDFQCQNISQSFVVGELRGEEVGGMALSTSLETTLRFGEVTQKLEAVRENLSTLKVDPCQKSFGRSAPVVLNTSTLKDLHDSLDTLQLKLSFPGGAPANLQWKSESKLKQLLASTHRRCPGIDLNDEKKSWTIGRVSGRCTDDRLATVMSTVTTPKTVTNISQLQLPEIIKECASKRVLLVVICLATYAQEPSAFARLLAEKAHAALEKKFRGEGGNTPVRLVAIELTESPTFGRQYGVREAPYCLMFRGGSLVYSERLSASKVSLRDTYMARPRVLLIEPLPCYQLKLERTLRRCGYESDLALDFTDAVRLALAQRYGIILVSAILPPEQLHTVVDALRRNNENVLLLAYNSMSPGEQEVDLQARKSVLDGFAHVFPSLPSYTGLANVFSRHESVAPVYKHVGQSKQDFIEEILSVLAQGGRSVVHSQ